MLWIQTTCVLVLAFAIAVAQDVASSGRNFSGEPEITVPSHFESLKAPYHLTPKTRYPSEKLRTSSTSDCLIDTVPCPDGSEVCINPFKYLGCAFDAISPIKLEDLAKGMADVLEGFVSDSVEFAEEAVRDFVESAETCWKGIAGKSTDCSTLGTFEACRGGQRTGSPSSWKDRGNQTGQESTESHGANQQHVQIQLSEWFMLNVQRHTSVQTAKWLHVQEYAVHHK